MNNIISKENSLLLKGIGILLIVFHNFFHLLDQLWLENEFNFNVENFDHFISNINLVNAPSYIFSLFGHYGVSIFIFLSGYGLTVAYRDKNIAYRMFIKKRLLLLYPTFTIAIIFLLIYKYGIGHLEFNIETLIDVFLRYTLIANLIPGKIFILSGPWWFYSMIVQLYLLFPLFIVLHKKHKYALWCILFSSFIITFFANPIFLSIDLSLYYNFLGNTPVFVLGMIMAFNKTLYIKKWMLFLSLILLITGQMNIYLWPLTQLSFVMLILSINFKYYKKYRKSYFSEFLVKTGELSMYMFAVNGFLREPWVGLSNGSISKFDRYFYALIFLLLVYLIAFFVKYIEKKSLKWLTNKYHFFAIE